MRIGVGRCEMVLPQDFLPTEGFVKQVHPLFVRALFIEEKHPFALVSIEMTSLSDEECERIRKETAILLGTEESQVWVAATHTFSAPHILPDPVLKTEEDREKRTILQRTLSDAVRAAVWQAKREAAPSTLLLRQGETGVVQSRDIELPEGWWIGCGGSGDTDRALTVLEVRQEGKVKALLLHANVQSSVLDGTGAAGGKCVSGDLAGIVCHALEKRYPGSVVLFMIGAAGDQAPVKRAKGYAPNAQGGYSDIDLHEAGVPVAQELGEQLAGEVATLLSSHGKELSGEPAIRHRVFHAPAKQMNRNLHELRPTRECTWVSDGDKEQVIELLTLDTLSILGVKPELTYPTLKQLQAICPSRVTLVATMINGGAKYMADQTAYDRCMYEAINSPFAPGAAEMLVREATALMNS
ncbi:MAG: hypothetical protein IJ229_14430 [Clostridia bacterium]|nr:hypothetical protein [Clostridia bacterium]